MFSQHTAKITLPFGHHITTTSQPTASGMAGPNPTILLAPSQAVADVPEKENVQSRPSVKVVKPASKSGLGSKSGARRDQGQSDDEIAKLPLEKKRVAELKLKREAPKLTDRLTEQDQICMVSWLVDSKRWKIFKENQKKFWTDLSNYWNHNAWAKYKAVRELENHTGGGDGDKDQNKGPSEDPSVTCSRKFDSVSPLSDEEDTPTESSDSSNAKQTKDLTNAKHAKTKQQIGLRKSESSDSIESDPEAASRKLIFSAIESMKQKTREQMAIDKATLELAQKREARDEEEHQLARKHEVREEEEYQERKKRAKKEGDWIWFEKIKVMCKSSSAVIRAMVEKLLAENMLNGDDL
ncbi:hypothetical protein JR316_0011479 [Psilocybe cubensis]|uniref:Uncharacterized protein n=1 Tax=Psilocybe cubensis TaxID=181762 RepID=A0ACB8GK64_PSICU|nr:hypothetical protein JR316_0011479 [Psilocybe cubensis]KAH9475918.1 hypothetical protein JR316_0011479 [Psilocybe cubensis]